MTLSLPRLVCLGRPCHVAAAVSPSPGPTSSSCSIRLLLTLDLLCDLATLNYLDVKWACSKTQTGLKFVKRGLDSNL